MNNLENHSAKGLHVRICNCLANTLFDKGHETALVMLILSAISIYSSHTAQISGLEKSNRKNKQFLIDQEKNERKIDLFLSTIPPLFIKNFLSLKFNNSQMMANSTFKKIKDSKLIDPINNRQMSLGNSLEKAVYKIDSESKFEEKLKNMSNKKLHDELIVPQKGLLIAAHILYTIISINIIMPIYKNIKTNRMYEKKLNQNSIFEKHLSENNYAPIFNQFQSTENKLLNKNKEQIKQKNFSEFKNYTNMTPINFGKIIL